MGFNVVHDLCFQNSKLITIRDSNSVPIFTSFLGIFIISAKVFQQLYEIKLVHAAIAQRPILGTLESNTKISKPELKLERVSIQ